MPRTVLPPIEAISVDIPADATTIDDGVKTTLRNGIHEILLGLNCRCNGAALARVSVENIVQQSIKTTALARKVDLLIKEVAISRNLDADATPVVLAAAFSQEEMGSILSYAQSQTTPDLIDSLVSDAEKADIESRAIIKGNRTRDPEWEKDITQLVDRAVGHQILRTEGPLVVAENVMVRLETIRVEVDDNGEICCWNYEELVI